MSKKKNYSNVISLIFVFFQSLMMVVLFGMVLLYFVLFSTLSISNSLENSDYYRQVRSYSLERMHDILIPSGLPDSVIEGVFMLDTYQSNIEAYIRHEIDGETYTFDSSLIRENLNHNIMVYLEGEGLTEYVETETVEEILDVLIETYESGLRFPFISLLSTYIGLYERAMMIVAPICIVLIVFCLIMLYKINQWKHRFYRYCALSFGSTALMLAGIPLGLLMWGGHTKIVLEPDYINSFIQTHINSALITYILVGFALLLLEVLLICVSEKKKKGVSKRVSVDLDTHDGDEEIINLRELVQHDGDH